MKRKSVFHLGLFVIILLMTGLACQAARELIEDDYQYTDEAYSDGYDDDYDESRSDSYNPPADNTVPATGMVCPAVTGDILSTATQFVDDSEAENAEEQDGQNLVTYEISGNQISNPIYETVSDDLQSYQDDSASHQQIWEYFVTLIPANERVGLKEFMIMTDGESNGLAAVAQTIYDPSLWSLEVDIIDSSDKMDLTYTLIHEYAHLLTLGPEQVAPSLSIFNNPDDEDIFYEESSACPVYFPGEGCSNANSYINSFYTLFWADIHEEWQDINLIEDEDEYYAALDDFYFEYEDRFVTDYAATNPEEDIAEAFTFFVLSPRPEGATSAEQKILFFYDYPELVQLRTEITTGICSISQ